ncbi:MAG: hypothetical protein QOF58_5263 [Pseudonocardiales bacterium]|jgi:hypothetical protein|nr:hypothetical protein [Pseudonocardiales bacterium]
MGDDEIVVRVPDELPPLTPAVSRALLAILVELTDVAILDGPADDC